MVGFANELTSECACGKKKLLAIILTHDNQLNFASGAPF